MKWPEVDVREPFDKMEKRLGIKKESNDIRPTHLGSHPSESFYSNKEPKINLERMKAKFDKVAQKY